MLSCTIGNRTFSIVPEANPTAEAFASLLPMTLHMTELNGNEKYHTLLSPLPSRPERIGHVEAGDLMLFGDDCIVLFYKSFRTPYSYTRIEDSPTQPALWKPWVPGIRMSSSLQNPDRESPGQKVPGWEL